MTHTSPAPRIAVYAPHEPSHPRAKGCGLWAPGYAAAIEAAGATPVLLHQLPSHAWDESLQDVDGVLFAGDASDAAHRQTDGEQLCVLCRTLGLPLLAVNQGLHLLNTAHGGTLHLDLAREVPTAVQHLHPSEPGDRHAINVEPATRVARCYGEGEVVVNSEHRLAVRRVAKGFRVSARALDGVIEAIEPEGDDWYAVGVQWLPASAFASGLDIQLFRGLVEACQLRQASAVAVAA